MKIEREDIYVDYILDVTSRLLAVDSPSGFTKGAAEFVMKEFASLGFSPELTGKGGVLVRLGGRDKGERKASPYVSRNKRQ